MILRGASGAHICWQCRMSLSKWLPTNQVLLTRFLRPKNSRLQHNNAFGEGSKTPDSVTPEAEHLRNGFDGGITWNPSKIRQDSQGYRAWRPLEKKGVTKYPLGRLHGFCGHNLREKRAKLGVDSLGAPSEVIVLRNAGFITNPLPSMDDLEPTERVDILSQVAAERGIVSQADVEENIDHFRPKTNTISWDEFQQIQRQLVSSFTIRQLVRYIDSKGCRAEKVEQQQQPGALTGSTGANVIQSQWIPQISVPGVSVEESQIGGYDSEAFTRKQRLALLLLRQCWHLEAQEVIDSIGELELGIPRAELELLIGGHNPPLKAICDSFITTQEEKIEAFRSDGVVRITAGKEKSELLAREIRTTLESIYSLIIDLDALISGPRLPGDDLKGLVRYAYDKSLVSELAKITETRITRLPNNQISVSCIHAKPQLHLSTKADVARRLLLTSSDLANHTKTLHFCKTTLEPIIAVRYHTKNGMSWRDRLRNWVRWIAPTAKPLDHHKETELKSIKFVATDASSVNEIVVGKSASAALGELPVSASLSEGNTDQLMHQKKSKSSSCTYWDTSIFTETSALIGHVLYEASATSETSIIGAKVSPAQRTTFHHAPINISTFLGTMALLHEPPTSSLVLRFFPSPWTIAGPQASVSLPLVEMRFTVNPNTKNLQLKDVVAIMEYTASDVMLPDRTADIRFQQRTLARLRSLNLDQLPQVSEFLKVSQLDLTGGRLETPPKINLPIESHMCSAKLPKTPENIEENPVNYEYIFGGLEYRSTFSLDFRGWQLLYTSVEGGKADGRRGELSLMPHRVKVNAKDGKRSSSDLTRDYIQAAHLLVDTLANQGITSTEEIHAFVKLDGTNMNHESSHKNDLEKRTALDYFRHEINFTSSTNQKGEFDKELGDNRSVAFEASEEVDGMSNKGT